MSAVPPVACFVWFIQRDIHSASGPLKPIRLSRIDVEFGSGKDEINRLKHGAPRC
jgi:hypothetical protein